MRNIPYVRENNYTGTYHQEQRKSCAITKINLWLITLRGTNPTTGLSAKDYKIAEQPTGYVLNPF